MTESQYNNLMETLDDINYSIQHNNTGEILEQVQNIRYDTEEIVSGEEYERIIIQNNHNEMLNNTSVYLGCINLILMVTLLLSLLPAKKGVAKKC